MTKHRRKRNYRKITIAAFAVGAVAVPSVALACLNGQGDEDGQADARSKRDFSQSRHQHHHWSATDAWSPTPTVKPAQSTKAPSPSSDASHSAPPSKAPSPSSPPSHSAPPTKAPVPPSPASPSAPPASGTAARILEIVNSERSKAGCSPLTLNAKLNKAAQDHSKDMAGHSNMSHTGSDGSSPGDRITQAGYNWTAYGENVAYGYSTPESVMRGWMSSPGHKRNILDCSFKEMGVGLAQPGDYWTQDFGTAG
ncbi:CAP domain-containing protein [Streptomyces natalensis]|uniref:SCP domain-containing protein n=1 Tax=Streptomyces natalensis ATCC 27448 TaxID=1240678 RepID=A0A0D7CI27_9ACTN|nr:CAP domain-containing protein [Streptomyces natalensis]KIZ15843.1 hypothetical protein SNA_21370 [Streptomyces natalensis ATCC 27448]